MTDLGALLDPPPPGSILHYSGAIEIDERGQIVSEVTTSSGISDFKNDVVLWTLPRRR
jgi:hypothetical protein